jgi:hypothetical protein
LITRLDRGGSAELTLQLAAGLSRHGYDVTLISGKTVEPLWNPEEYAQQNGFSLIYVNSLLRSIRPLKDVLALIHIIIRLRQIRPGIWSSRWYLLQNQIRLSLTARAYFLWLLQPIRKPDFYLPGKIRRPLHDPNS